MSTQLLLWIFRQLLIFFGKEIFSSEQIPIGLINAALGGSPVEAWMSEVSLKQFPASYEELQKFKDNKLIEKIRTEDQNRIDGWYKMLNDKDQGFNQGVPDWSKENLREDDWQDFTIPGFWADNPDTANLYSAESLPVSPFEVRKKGLSAKS